MACINKALDFEDMTRGSDWTMVWTLVQDAARTPVVLSGTTAVAVVKDDDDAIVYSGACTIDEADGSITASVAATYTSGLSLQVLSYRTTVNLNGAETLILKGFIYTE